jgi:hypothetical protein
LVEFDVPAANVLRTRAERVVTPPLLLKMARLSGIRQGT